MRNLRLSCCGGGNLIPIIRETDRCETLEMLVSVENPNKCGEIERIEVEAYLGRVVGQQASVCSLCGVRLQLLLITPCGHLICAMCITQDTHKCGV